MKPKINKDLFVDLYFNQKLTFKKMAKKTGWCIQTLHKYFHLFGLKASMPEKAWNSGKSYKDDPRILAGEKHPRWQDISKYYIDFKKKSRKMRENRVKCYHCDKTANLLHHKDKNTRNNDDNNLLPLCWGCHTRLHNLERGKTINNLKCLWCNNNFTTFYPSHSKQKFCSQKCSSLYHYHIEKKSIFSRNKTLRQEKMLRGV